MLIKCPNCGCEFSDVATDCPLCGPAKGAFSGVPESLKLPPAAEAISCLVVGTVADDAELVEDICELTVLDEEAARTELVGLRAAAAWMTLQLLGEEAGGAKVTHNTLVLQGIDEKQARVVAERRLPYSVVARWTETDFGELDSEDIDDAIYDIYGELGLRFRDNGERNVGILFAHYCGCHSCDESPVEGLAAGVFADTCREVRRVVAAASTKEGPMREDELTLSPGFVLARVIAALAALLAVASLPYGYYVLLRWVVCPVAAYTALQAAKLPAKGWSWVFGVLALVFNPILPVHLTREVWPVVDLAACVLLFASLKTVRPR